MAMASLLHFIDSSPSGRLSDSPEHWLEHCLATAAHGVVMVDQADRPLGLLPLYQIVAVVGQARCLSILYRQGTTQPDSVEVGGTAGAVVHLLESVALLPMTMPPAIAVQRVAAAPEVTWVLVDAQHRYVGRVDVPKLLAIAIATESSAQPIPDDPPSEAEAKVTPDPLAELGEFSTLRSPSSLPSALLTYLGHELKTPLTSLLGLSSLLATQRLGDLNERQAHYVELIQQHTRRLTGLVNTVLDLGRVEAGTLQLLPQSVDISSLCWEAYHQVAAKLGNPQRLHPSILNAIPQLPEVSLVADPLRLGQMLAYLMHVAWRSSAEIGRFPLTVEVWDGWAAFLPVLTPDDDPGASPSRVSAETTWGFVGIEVGCWLELLLTRRLAQLHGGDLVQVLTASDRVMPALLLPLVPRCKGQGMVLLLSQSRAPLAALHQQLAPMDYHLLVTADLHEAQVAIAHLAPTAVLVYVEHPGQAAWLGALRQSFHGGDRALIALVPPQRSTPLDITAADYQVLWPSNQLSQILAEPSQPPVAPVGRLTVLYLKAPTLEPDTAPEVLPHHLQNCGCRVLEVDDLDQANLLKRVWRPDVAILDPAIATPSHYLHALSQLPDLTELPIVTLTAAATQTAHQFPQLTVFPCLVGDCTWEQDAEITQMSAWLIQVLQVAAAHQRRR